MYTYILGDRLVFKLNDLLGLVCASMEGSTMTVHMRRLIRVFSGWLSNYYQNLAYLHIIYQIAY